MTPNIRDIAIVIPMYNEVDSAPHLLTEIQTILQNTQLNYEIVVVDDGSTDGTDACLKSLQAQIPQLKVVHHQNNYGQSAGLVTGARAASKEWIVTLDGDGQNDPQDILTLVQALEQSQKINDAVLVVGTRVKRNDSPMRKFSSRTANAVRGYLLQDACPDTGCSLKLFKREIFLRMPHFNHLHRFMPALFVRAGGKVINVPVNHRPRLRGQSKYGLGNRLWVGIVDLFGMMWLVRRPCSPQIIECPISNER